MSPHPQSVREGEAEPYGVPARRQTCSGGARAGEAEIRASVRKVQRHRAAANGRRGLPAAWGVMPTQPHYTPLSPAQLPQANSPPPQGQVSTHLSTQNLQGQGQGCWDFWGASQKLGSLLGTLRLCPSICNRLHLSRGGRRACVAAGCPRCHGGMQGKPYFCLSIHLRRSLQRKRGAVSQEGMGWQGRFVPKAGLHSVHG